MSRRVRTLFVMAKFPALGRGKSRIAVALGRVEALRINRWLHARTRAAAMEARWRTVLAVSPDAHARRRWPGAADWHMVRIGQGRGDLGARMTRLLKAAPHGAVAFIGTDCPGMRRVDIARAFARASRDGVHLIPATDGGFVLIAARSGARLARAFEGVRWSSAATLADVTANLAAAGQRFSLAPPMSDVDTAEDWRRAARVRVSPS